MKRYLAVANLIERLVEAYVFAKKCRRESVEQLELDLDILWTHGDRTPPVVRQQIYNNINSTLEIIYL